MRISPRSLRRVAVIFLAIGFSAAAYFFGFFDSFQDQLSDRLFVRGPQSQKVVIVAVDDASISQIGQWPFARSVFARAVTSLQNARAIGIDISFSEPSSRGASDDQALADALRTSRVPVVFPVELAAQGAVTVAPLPLFRNASLLERSGFVNIIGGADGVVRQIDSTRSVPGGNIKSFSSALAFAATSSRVSAPPERMRIWYGGPAGTFLTVSLADLIDGRLPPRIFDNAYVLIGATAATLRDTAKTPFGEMPGVEVHANAVNDILEGKYLSDAPLLLSLFLLAAFGLAASLSILKLRRFSFLSSALVALVALAIAGPAAAFSFGIIMPSLYFLLCILLVSISMIALEYVFESKEKRFIRESFQRYLSADVVNELIESPHKLALGGERRAVTILFSDIRGFTALSEALSPEGLVEIMNEYLTAMSDIIMANGGLVDKYIGDAIMAFWGAPLSNENQASDACNVAALMDEELKKLNAHWASRGLPKIGIGVGINSGEVIVGNMGSARRFNYTIMGDEVNFASRLEGLNKMYGTSCIISEGARLAMLRGKGMPEGTHLRELDTVTVKGKSAPKKIYELLSLADRGQKSAVEIRLAKFEIARKSYEKGEWDAAIPLFKAILSESHDGPSSALLLRCEEFKKNPPESWNGVYAFHSK